MEDPILRPKGRWEVPARRSARMIGPDEFIFLNEKGSLAHCGWDGPEREKLWRYNQHYFDDLNAKDAEERTQWHLDLLGDWVLHNAPFEGNGWEPYPTSLRIINWIKWALKGNQLPVFCLQSMVIQTRWLEKRIEWHLLGNHLFVNAKALVFAGVYFIGEEADRWLNKGIQILNREIFEQILPDGGHFERSTMYHALILEDLLDLCNLFECYKEDLPECISNQQELWRKFAAQMLTWLDAMCHTDGEISFFNDAAFNVAPSCRELRKYSSRLKIGSQSLNAESKYLDDSGYVRLECEEAVVLLDVAPIGPDYLPGHAHADTLCFEMSMYGQRLLINTGTSCYRTSKDRLFQRSTPAHNTVAIDQKDSSEVWHNFRVARRATPFKKDVSINSLPMNVEFSHNGYRRLRGKPIHTRRWQLNYGLLIVEDTVDTTELSAQARFYFHPKVKLKVFDQTGIALLPGGQEVNWFVESGRSCCEDSEWYPQFGESLQNKCLVVDLVDGKSKVCWFWD